MIQEQRGEAADERAGRLTLREPSVSYGAHFGAEDDALSAENASVSEETHALLGACGGPTRDYAKDQVYAFRVP